MEANRVYNFNPGPAMQPLEVLKEAQAEFLNFQNTGESILEISHRAKEFEAVLEKAKTDIKELMGLGEDYDVLLRRSANPWRWSLGRFHKIGRFSQCSLAGRDEDRP